MRTIDMKNWPRRAHFELFNSLDYPHSNMCANVDVTEFHRTVKQLGFSFNSAMVYVLARAANAVPEFRQRIRDGEVVEHEIVHPSTTIMTDDGLFSFCEIKYAEDFALFARRAQEQIDQVKAQRTLEDEPGRDDLLFLTAVPWVSFTAIVHPIHMHPVDSIPRLGWGKFFPEGRSLKMPLSVQVHHALVDGLHVARFYAEVQDYMDRPELWSAPA